MPPKSPNIVILAADTLRADHLGCYGYHRQTSPVLDELAARSVLAERFFCPAVPTHPSFTCFYTGQWPTTHGIVSQGGNAKLDSEAPFLTEILRRAGYRTAAVDTLRSGADWFGRGYDEYIDPSGPGRISCSIDARIITRHAREWIASNTAEPFFLFLHFWDTHTPYVPPGRYRDLFYDGDPCDWRLPDTMEEYRAQELGPWLHDYWVSLLPDGRNSSSPVRDVEYIISLYDAALRHLDEQVGLFLDEIQRLGLWDDTIFVLLGDHGEMMHRHGIYFDHHGLYDGNVRVPLLIRLPGDRCGGTRLSAVRQMPDLAPTLLDLAGVSGVNAMDGTSFAQTVRGGTDEEFYDHVLSLECTWQAKWSFRTVTRQGGEEHPHKIIVSREPDMYGNPHVEFYNLSCDPDELHDLADEIPGQANEFRDRLEDAIRQRLEKSGMTEDPLVKQGLSLGKRWRETPNRYMPHSPA